MAANKKNYKEPPNLRIYKSRKPRIQIVCKVPPDSQETIYYKFQDDKKVVEFMENVPNGETEWYPFKLLQLVLYNNDSAIETNIFTKEGKGKCIIILDEWKQEHYLAALASVSKSNVINNGWITKTRYEKLLLPSSYKPKYDLNETAWLTLRVICNHHPHENCSCNQLRIVVEGTISELSPHTFPLQLSPQFKFAANDQQFAAVANEWVYTAQLSKTQIEWRYISVSDIQLEELRHLLSIDITTTLTSSLITQIIPRDINLGSAYFGKTNLYL
eukprot:258584_1